MANILNKMIMINSKSSSLLSSHLTTSSSAYAVLAAGHDHSLIPMTQPHPYSHSPSPASASEMPRTAGGGEYLAPPPPPNGGGMKKAAAKQEVFWMRDPKTGNWIPENHLYGGDHHHHHLLDSADLRAKLLSNNQHNQPL